VCRQARRLGTLRPDLACAGHRLDAVRPLTIAERAEWTSLPRRGVALLAVATWRTLYLPSSG
jgi:hypothetical protein